MGQRPTTIVLANQKGGCGKTTTSISFAAGLVERGHHTCIVDLDPQCNVTSVFDVDLDQLRRDGKYTILDAYTQKRKAVEIALSTESGGVRFGLLPGHRALDQVHPKLEAELLTTITHGDQSPLDEDDIRAEQRLRLRTSLDTLGEFFEYVVIDTPPALGFLLTSALIAADRYIIPVFASGFDLDGLSKLTTTVRKVRERANPGLELLGVVLGNFDSSTTLDADIFSKLQQRFGDKMCKTKITRSVKHREATVHQSTIFEHAPGTPAANQFLDLTDELLARIPNEAKAEEPDSTAELPPPPPSRQGDEAGQVTEA